MARDSFLLRIDPKVLAAMRRWADDEMRSVNAQIEFILRGALRDAGRLPSSSDSNVSDSVSQQNDAQPPLASGS